MSTQLILTSDSARIGRLWFKYRSFAPLPWLILALILPPEFIPSPVVYWVAGGLVVLAEGLRLWAVGFAGSVTRTRSDGATQLVHAGPYRYVRNPLYLANITLYTSCCILFGFKSISFLMAACSIVQYSFIVSFEERILNKAFGLAYNDYCSKVRRWLPSFSSSIAPSPHSFSFTKAVRSERSTLLAIAVTALLYFLKTRFL